MVTYFGVSHFRAFKSDAVLQLAPLTCLVGRNSSGKSSILSALLILRQSVEQRAIGSRLPQLNLNGPIIDAGRFEDIVNGHDPKQEVGFTFGTKVDLASYYHIAPESSPGLVEIDVPRPSQLRYGFGSSRISDFLIRTRKQTIRNVNVEMDFLPEPPFGPTLSRLLVEIPDLGSATFTRTLGETRVQHWRAYLSGLPKKSLELSFPRWSFLPAVTDRLEQASAMDSHGRKRVIEFASAASLALRDVQAFLLNLRLLGPFRTPPERRYSFTGFGALDSGTTGERAIDLLITEKLVRPDDQQLRKAVSYWLRRLGLASSLSITTIARGSNLFELSLSGAGTARAANYADVGFGISQVLPVLVQGFLVPIGGTYIVQQPEIHLHPDAQAALADFFLYLASHGISSIVETHSEYLLLRLRRRLAEGLRQVQVGIGGEEKASIGLKQKGSVAVVMVGEHQHSAFLRPLEVGASFQFENLPDGFMNQSVSDRLELLKALRR